MDAPPAMHHLVIELSIKGLPPEILLFLVNEHQHFPLVHYVVMVGAPLTLSFHFFAFEVFGERSLRGQPLHKFLKSETGITIKVESSNNSHHFLRGGFTTIFL